MRTLKLTMMVALALALGAANANASSVDIIWQGSNSGTTVATGGAHTANIVLTIGGGDTGLGGGGAGLTLSADSTGGATMTAGTQVVIAGWLNLASTAGTPSDPHWGEMLSQGDLFGSGASLAPGSSTIIGTITVTDDGTAGTVLMGVTGAGNDIVNPGAVSLLGEFTFGGGNITVIPEPTTASLLGLGLLGLSVAGRNRKN